ncbi:prepilin-type N-terminal cleavage/methylation domain-containing protein [uncultured Gemmiger sp.]|uniref:prepilin-type N-terminal cleavage/methylation domain-containing protein n=1 Tax=uncultured Gemmiger sp. TaxID=1623490 RepID=UPI0027DCB854|nr:prepilin-type N-terminal cleavage/methylation domain-containing protein [uncultured Gemmiger sp.]
MNRRNERQKGFTLIELLVVLIIIAVLAAVLVPALTSYVDDAREKKAVSEAQVCVTAATEWAAVQRTALISQAYQNNKPFADAYKAAADTAKWSTDYDALNTAAPTVTGTLALAEGDGQYFLRPDSTPDDTTDLAMKTTVQTAAGVDGRLEKMQLNADGKVLYLLYTSAEGISVAYTAAGTAQDPATTVPVATLPPDTTPPKPTEPNHSGDLVFCVKDEYTGKPVPGIKFHVEDLSGKTVFGSRTTDAKGMVYFNLDPATLETNSKRFKLIPDNWSEGYQQVFYVEFHIDAYDNDNDNSYDSYRIGGIDYNKNHETANYRKEEVDKLEGGADRHLCTFYVRPVPTLELRVWDDDNGNYLNGVKFTLSKDGQSIPITSGLTNTVLDVKLHEKDNLRPGRETKCLDMSQYGNYAEFLVKFTNYPTGYQYFDDCCLKIKLENQLEHNWQLSTEFQEGQTVNGNQSHTDIKCENLPSQNKSIVTIHVKGGKKVNFCVYDGLDSVHTAQLPNVKLQLSKQGAGEIATFTTDGNGAGNFTQTLSEGEYTLHLVSGTPSGYTQPADITFKVERVNGLLTLTGDAAYVDNSTSSVTMLVTKPNTMRFKLQVVDANTKQPWAGVNVKVTGNSLQATDDSKRYYAIDSSANNTHTIDLDLLKSGDIKVTIVGSDNKDSDFEDGYHNDSYTNNFVGSKYVFNLNKNEDGTFTLTEKSGKEGFNGEINGNTVMVYAYPQVIVDFNTKGIFAGVGIAGRKSILHIVTSEDAIPTTVNGEELSTWKVKPENHNHSVGLSLGSYKLYEERETYGYYTTLNLPLQFKVTRQANGFPAVTDPDGNQILDYDTKQPYKDEKGNILPKITAWYKSTSYVEP